MAITQEPQLEKTGLAPIEDVAAVCVDRLVDEAYYLLMLNDDVAAAGRDVDLLVAALRLRWRQVLRDVEREFHKICFIAPGGSSTTISVRADDPVADELRAKGWTVYDEWIVRIDDEGKPTRVDRDDD